MRTVLFDGTFGFKSEQVNTGLVVLCHFEPGDNEVVLHKAAKKLTTLTASSLILVPFVHLYEKAASKEVASVLFKNLVESCNDIAKDKDIIPIPYGIEKEFILKTPANDSAIKFMKFG